MADNVPKKKTKEEEAAEMAKIEAMVTPEQVLTANVAKKRRIVTRKRSTSAGRVRSKTPARLEGAGGLDDDDSSDDKGAAKPRKPERRARKFERRTVSNTVKLLPDDDGGTNRPDDDRVKVSKNKALSDDADKKAEDVAKIASEEKTETVKTKMEVDDVKAKQNEVDDVKANIEVDEVKTKVQLDQVDVAKTENAASSSLEIKETQAEEKTAADSINTPNEKTKTLDTSAKPRPKTLDETKAKLLEPVKPQVKRQLKTKRDMATTTQRTKSVPREIFAPAKTESDRQSIISSTSSATTLDRSERSSSLPRQLEAKLMQLDTMISTNKKEVINLLQKAKNTVEEKGREIRRRRFQKSDQKRSQSQPKDLSDVEILESFKKAQKVSAEREKQRRSKSAQHYKESASETEELTLKPTRPVRKTPSKNTPKSKAEAIDKIKKLKRSPTNKIVEILDPKTSKVIAVRNVGKVVGKISILDLLRVLKQFGPRKIFKEYRKYKSDMHQEYNLIRVQRRRCITHLVILMIFCGLGGMAFKFIEGAFENFYKCGVKRVKRDFIDLLWVKSHNMREEEWKSLARNRLRFFEDELHTAHEAGVHSYSGQRSWSFLNGIVYCLTVVTTIGYGHLYPTTKTGQALTIVYSLIGIPLFLIILTDFGKLFTRCLKFLWSFLRRLYYTGSCRSVRKQAQVQEIFKGAQMMYEFATFRRQSVYDPNMNQHPEAGDAAGSTAPPTPAISNFEIDDDFNLPISVALLLLVLYMILGAVLFGIWEHWDFFASFYFVFISMSTIGFGDYVPRHPVFMIVSIVYLVFGLALMSMCINVVQVKLSDTFNQASAKIGATIGLTVAEEDGSVKPVTPKIIELPQVHGGSVNDINVIRDESNSSIKGVAV